MLTRAFIDRAGRACLRRAACRLQPAVRAPRRGARRFADMLHCRRGVAQLEFALVAAPFLLLLCGIIEVSVMLFTSSIIEGATKEAARRIRTGQIQGTANPLESFRSELCTDLYGLIDCSKVLFHVQTFPSFQTVTMPLEFDEDGEIVNTTFVPGTSGAVTVVRSMYRWEFLTPLIANAMPSGPGGHLIVSTVAFQNEPYSVN